MLPGHGRDLVAVLAMGHIYGRVYITDCAPRSLNPSPSYYQQFNGYTLGLLFAVLAMGALWVTGKSVLARLTLRHCSEPERTERLAKFSSTVLQRMLLVLYLVYPGARQLPAPSRAHSAHRQCHALSSCSSLTSR
jgi:hypothetical protein